MSRPESRSGSGKRRKRLPSSLPGQPLRMANTRGMAEKRGGFVRDPAGGGACSHVMAFIDKVGLLELVSA